MELKIAQIQMPVTADREENIRCACDMVRQAGDIDMAVLPEMFCCPYDNACFRPYGEEEGGPAYRALSALARERGIWLVGGTLPELAEGTTPAMCLRLTDSWRPSIERCTSLTLTWRAASGSWSPRP